MVIVTSSNNKKEIKVKYGYKLPTICQSLRFDSSSYLAHKIRSIVMNEYKSYFLDLPSHKVHLKCRN